MKLRLLFSVQEKYSSVVEKSSPKDINRNTQTSKYDPVFTYLGAS